MFTLIRRLNEQTYNKDEVVDVLSELSGVVKGDMETELIHVAHTNALLLRQVWQADPRDI